jgi:hypothetical protein
MRLQQPCTHASSGQSQPALIDYYFELSDSQRKKYFLDTYDLAKKYGIAQRTVQEWINLGRIEAVLVGKKYKVYLPSFESHIRQAN